MKVPAVFFCSLFFAGAASAENIKAVATATYAVVDRAFMKRDLNAMKAVMGPRVTPDFKAIVGGHSVTYAYLLDNFRGMFKAFSRISKSTTKIQSLVPNGNAATLKVFSSLVAFGSGPDKKTHRFDLTNTSEDVWKKVGGKWKLSTSTTLAETRSLDGKVIPTH